MWAPPPPRRRWREPHEIGQLGCGPAPLSTFTKFVRASRLYVWLHAEADNDSRQWRNWSLSVAGCGGNSMVRR